MEKFFSAADKGGFFGTEGIGMGIFFKMGGEIRGDSFCFLVASYWALASLT